MARGVRREPEALLAGESAGDWVGPLVWWPPASVLYLLLVPAWDPLGVGLLGCLLLVAGLVRAALRKGVPGRPDRG